MIGSVTGNGGSGGPVVKTGGTRVHVHFYVAGLILALAAMGFELWIWRLRSQGLGEVAPLARPLKEIPLALRTQENEEWRGTEYPMDWTTMQMAGPDDYVLRVYENDRGRRISLYVVFFGGIRLTAPHKPDICMPGAGFTVASSYRRTIQTPGMGEVSSISANVDVFSRDFDKDMLVWWEYIHGKNVTSQWRERLQWVMPLFLGGKAGSVVQVQIRVPVINGDEERTYAMIVDFIETLAPEVGKCLPEAH